MQRGNIIKFKRRQKKIPNLSAMNKEQIIAYLQNMSPEQLQALDGTIGKTLINRTIKNTANLTTGVQNGEFPEAIQTQNEVSQIFKEAA